MKRRTTLFSASLLAGALALTGCAGSDPLNDSADAPAGDKASSTIVIGSQDYYSNEIIAEAYALALEAEGYSVDREFRIGQREAYLPEIEAGTIDLFPEYTGNLLQFWEPETTARLAGPVYEELVAATPEGLRVLAESPATDEDAYMVTSQFAKKWNLKTIADLAKVEVPLTLGGNSEVETRPYGPAGLAETYGVKDVAFTPVEDGGGPLTVKALTDGSIQFANIYTADPSVVENDLVVLEDPKGIFLASHVVPLVSDRIDADAEKIIDRVSLAMTPTDLVEMNARSVKEQLPAAEIAQEWLASKDLV